jgi:outer membrane autotransporter protein
VVQDAILIYGCVGATHSWFGTAYEFRDVDVELEHAETGLSLGAGVEFPTSVNLRMRLDYSRPDYGSHAVDYEAGVGFIHTS